MCIFDVMRLGEKKPKIAQYYGVHTETLLHGTDTNQAKDNITGVLHLSGNCCLGKSVDKQGEVKSSQPDMALPDTLFKKTESKVQYWDLPSSKLSQSTYNVRLLSSASLISLGLIIPSRPNMHCCAVLC